MIYYVNCDDPPLTLGCRRTSAVVGRGLVQASQIAAVYSHKENGEENRTCPGQEQQPVQCPFSLRWHEEIHGQTQTSKTA